MAPPDFRDWYDLPGNDPETLDLPIGGKAYQIEHPGARVTGNLIAMHAAARAALERAEAEGGDLDPDADAGLDIDPHTLYVDALGDTYDDMIADNVPAAALARAFHAVQAWALHGTLDAAREVWEGKATPATATANREQRRNTSTRSPASGKGTRTTRRTTPPPTKAAATKARRSPGRASGSTGSS